MPYSNFIFGEVKLMFKLSTIENSIAVPKHSYNAAEIENLKETIAYNLPLATAIGTDKARGEMLIVPIL